MTIVDEDADADRVWTWLKPFNFWEIDVLKIISSCFENILEIMFLI